MQNWALSRFLKNQGEMSSWPEHDAETQVAISPPCWSFAFPWRRSPTQAGRPSLLGRALRLPRQVGSGSPLYAENNPFSFVQKNTDPLLCVCSRGCSWLKVPLARNPPLKPWAGTEIPFLWNRLLRGTGHFWGQRILWAAWRGSPSCRLDLHLQQAPSPLPGGEYSQGGICLRASSCSQLGAYLASSFMGDKEGMFVQVSLSRAQECLQGVVSEPVPLIWVPSTAG